MRLYYQIAGQKVVESATDDVPIHVYVNPDEGERRYLIDVLKIDEHTLLSALDPDELARLEYEPNHVAMIYKVPRRYSAQDQLVFRVSSVGLFVFKDQLVVVMPEKTPLFEGKQFLRVSGLSVLVLKIVYASIFHFLEHLKVINALSDELERKINASLENRYLINLFSLEKSLVYYLNSITSNGVLIERLKLNAGKLGYGTEETEFIDDMVIENNQCARQAEIYSNILAGLMDARASIVSNNLNVLMKTLNIITIALMVPTFVVSVFSMNVRLPFGFDDEWNHWSFWLIMILAILSMVGFYFAWKRVDRMRIN